MNLPQGYWPHEVPREYTGQVWIESQMRAHAVAAMLAEREACIKIVEHYRVSVGNSAAGERAAEWTMDNLREVRDEIRARPQP